MALKLPVPPQPLRDDIAEVTKSLVDRTQNSVCSIMLTREEVDLLFEILDQAEEVFPEVGPLLKYIDRSCTDVRRYRHGDAIEYEATTSGGSASGVGGFTAQQYSILRNSLLQPRSKATQIAPKKMKK